MVQQRAILQQMLDNDCKGMSMDDVKMLEASLVKQMGVMNQQTRLQQQTQIYTIMGLAAPPDPGGDKSEAASSVDAAHQVADAKPKAPTGALARFKKK